MNTDPDGSMWRVVATAAVAVANVLMGLVMKGVKDDLRQHGKDIAGLQTNMVTRAEMREETQEMKTTILRLHGENRSNWQDIADKLDKGSHTRHDIRDAAQAIQAMVREQTEYARRDRETRAHDRELMKAILEELRKKSE